MNNSKETNKRKRALSNPIERANNKNDELFVKDHLCPDDSSWKTWTHPKTQASYSLSLVRPADLDEGDFKACYNLVEETSRADYEASPSGWKPRHKQNEMRSPELRYILVKEGGEDTGKLCAFTSLMPTFEEGEPVVYCYEIHLKPDMRGTGLGKLLLSYLEKIAVSTPPITKVMLTCFVSNDNALSFYRKIGFERDPISPSPRKLRFGKTAEPSYLIMSKKVARRSTVEDKEEVVANPIDR